MPVIATNTAANSALRYLNSNAGEQAGILSKLASGSRITKASDDAAGLAIGTRVQSDVTTLSQAATNAAQGIAILQAADGGMARISDSLQRMKALATQSNSGSVTDNERTYIDAEFQQLADEIDGIAKGTRYNGDSLLDGTGDYAAGVDFMVGTSSADVIPVTLSAVDTVGLGVNSLDVKTQAAIAALSQANQIPQNLLSLLKS